MDNLLEANVERARAEGKSDEKRAREGLICPEGQQLCLSKDQCYHTDQVCDSIHQCWDRSDESNCVCKFTLL